MQRLLNIGAFVCATLCLAVTFLAAGFFACAGTSVPTQLLAQAFVTSGASPYTHDELVKSAVAIHDYSFGNHDINALNECMDEIYAAAQQDDRAPRNSTGAQVNTAAQSKGNSQNLGEVQEEETDTRDNQAPQNSTGAQVNTAAQSKGNSQNLGEVQGEETNTRDNQAPRNSTGAQVNTAAQKAKLNLTGTIQDTDNAEAKDTRNSSADLKNINDIQATTAATNSQNMQETVGEEYRLNSAAISHLDDCYALMQAVRVPLIVVAALAVAALAHVGVRCGRRHVGRALLCAGALTLALFLAAGAAALIDFNAFFSFFHGLFFPQGNWTFWYRSLLICSLPEGFWMGMGIIWLATTTLISILSCGVGAALVRKKPRRRTKEA